MHTKIPDNFKMVNETSVNASGDGHGFTKIAYFDEPYYLLVIYCVALFLIFIASLVGNILTCIVIYSDRSMHTATNYYLFNLAVSDLLVTFPILIFIYQILSQGAGLLEFEYGKMTCKFIICIHFMVVTVLWNNGILVMTALSIERYIAICYPMMLQGTPVWRRVMKIIGIIWVVALLEATPSFYTIDVFDTGTNLICFFNPTALAKLLTAIMAVVTFIVPLAVMMFVYTMIAFKVNDNNPKYNFKDTVLNNGSNRNKVNKLIIALTVSFVICWLPYFLLRILTVTFDAEEFARTQKLWGPAHKVAMFNCWFTAALNPLLFSVMSTKFRNALKKLWNKKIKKNNVLTDKSFSNTLQTSRITKMDI
ncbi:unnamed protein product [Chrysodeixis includens]|uniref:G-protein coupled receptors family 1 profile domain-containing protein n=1 Tax=Chrysodeixis includens TaxID=689277 RepID=A0A9P0FPH3_CHRIL|nr:unnamed protein product [Chrysodeixis includens]